jgi:hypothetical protein
MIMTNVAVAQHVAVHLPEQALLRRHDVPIERRLVCRLPVCLSFTLFFALERICGEGETLGLHNEHNFCGNHDEVIQGG